MKHDPYTPDALIEAFKQSLEEGTSVTLTSLKLVYPEPTPQATPLPAPVTDPNECSMCLGTGAADGDYVVLDDEEYWTSYPCAYCYGTGKVVK